MSKHTPGPWTACNSGLTEAVYSGDLIGADRRICEMIGPQEAANARLIAAAPDLLETLSDLVNSFPAGEDGMDLARKFGADAWLHAGRVLLAELED